MKEYVSEHKEENKFYVKGGMGDDFPEVGNKVRIDGRKYKIRNAFYWLSSLCGGCGYRFKGFVIVC